MVLKSVQMARPLEVALGEYIIYVREFRFLQDEFIWEILPPIEMQVMHHIGVQSLDARSAPYSISTFVGYSMPNSLYANVLNMKFVSE